MSQIGTRVVVATSLVSTCAFLFQNCSQFSVADGLNKKDFIQASRVFASLQTNIAAGTTVHASNLPSSIPPNNSTYTTSSTTTTVTPAVPPAAPTATPAPSPSPVCGSSYSPYSAQQTSCTQPVVETPPPPPPPSTDVPNFAVGMPYVQNGYWYNNDGSPITATDGPYAPERDPGGDPLVVSIGSETGESPLLNMLDPNKGVLFDLFGQASPPHSPGKVMVSWPTSTSVTNKYFITLPDDSGQVLGANQVFGNFTAGPDGQFASDGFAALRKWDGRRLDGSIDIYSRDGVIDRADAVFYRLRFWNDRNGDGIAQASELKTAAELGIVSIDLNYDPNFFEQDNYGNQARFKSVVKTKDGHMHLLFDLWLKTAL
jgi:hypothetical protein